MNCTLKNFVYKYNGNPVFIQKNTLQVVLDLLHYNLTDKFESGNTEVN